MMKELKAFYMAHGKIASKLDINLWDAMEYSPKLINQRLEEHGTSYQAEIDKAMTELIEKKEEEE